MSQPTAFKIEYGRWGESSPVFAETHDSEVVGLVFTTRDLADAFIRHMNDAVGFWSCSLPAQDVRALPCDLVAVDPVFGEALDIVTVEAALEVLS